LMVFLALLHHTLQHPILEKLSDAKDD